MVVKKTDPLSRKTFLSRVVQECAGGISLVISLWSFVAILQFTNPYVSHPFVILSALAIGAAGLVGLPSVTEFVDKKWNIHPSGKIRLLGFIILWILGIWAFLSAPIPLYG
ncbi:MAG: hypothetical protein Q8P05_00835 [Candidatus Diapherotrites archaeon]|nr:hypothetical protein [Candidatus Diapherotrites archaeon]